MVAGIEKDFPVNPELSSFVLSLIQALLKTGYYTPKHPEAQKARSGLHETLQRLLRGRGEISFVAVAESGRQEVYVGGIGDEPMLLSNFMIRSMAEMFTPKFIEYFEKKNLSSFSIKAGISKAEFEKFIDIMTESPLHEDTGINLRDKLAMDLLKNDILLVSTVFHVDLVGKGRKLPWRVEISLSRLRRDLNMIPMYRNLSEEKRQEIRRMVFEDIMRPLKEPVLIKEMLLNLDLIRRNIMGFEPDELEVNLIGHIDTKALPVILRDLLQNISDVKRSFENVDDVTLLLKLEYLRSITKKVADKFLGQDMCDEDILLGLVRNRVLSVDDIPPAFRQKIKDHLAFDRFMEIPEDFFKEIEEARDPVEVRSRIRVLFGFLPALFRAGRYGEILQIFLMAGAKGIDFKLREEPGLVDRICEAAYGKAAEGSKESQVELLNVLSSLKLLGAYVMISLLDNDSRFVRRQVIEMLPKKDSGMTPFLVEMYDRKSSPHFARNALKVLSSMGASGPDVKRIFSSGLKHPEPHVRKEAVQGMPVVFGKQGEGLLVPLLNDKDPEVRRKVMNSLASLGSSHHELLKVFKDTLTDTPAADESLRAEVVGYLPNIHMPPAKASELEDALLGILKESSLLSIVKKESDHVLSLKKDALAALGFIGSAKSFNIVSKYSSHRNQLLSQAAAESMRRIKERS